MQRSLRLPPTVLLFAVIFTFLALKFFPASFTWGVSFVFSLKSMNKAKERAALLT